MKPRLCACECGELVVGGRDDRRYVNHTHKRRAATRRQRQGTSGPPHPRLVVCACGCGTPLSGTVRREFVNVAHRMRAARRRLTANRLADEAYINGWNSPSMKPD